MHLCYLYVLCKRVEDLLGHCQSPGEVPLTCFVDNVLPRVIPVEITDGFLREESKKKKSMDGFRSPDLPVWRPHLKPQQVVHCADDDVDRCGVSCLSPQEVLEV